MIIFCEGALIAFLATLGVAWLLWIEEQQEMDAARGLCGYLGNLEGRDHED